MVLALDTILEHDYPKEYERLKKLAEGAAQPLDSALSLGYQFGLCVQLNERYPPLRCRLGFHKWRRERQRYSDEAEMRCERCRRECPMGAPKWVFWLGRRWILWGG